MQDNSNENVDSNNSISVPRAVDKVLDEIKDQNVKEKIRETVSVSFSAMGMMSGRKMTPFDGVMTKEHCTQFIESMDKSDEREYLDKKSARKYTFFTIIVGLIFLLALVFVLLKYNSAELIQTIIVPIITLLCGAIGGYGIGYKQGQDN